MAGGRGGTELAMKSTDPTPWGDTGGRGEWWLLSGLALLAFASGVAGFYEYDREHAGPVSLASATYHAVQLFGLHSPHLEQRVPPLLHLGRWGAALVFFWALARVFLAV